MIEGEARQGVEVLAGTRHEPASHVVMDAPFDRARSEVRHLIDFVVCLDVPLEIAVPGA